MKKCRVAQAGFFLTHTVGPTLAELHSKKTKDKGVGCEQSSSNRIVTQQYQQR